MTREIPLTQGYVALVDDADYEWLSQWKWHVAKNKSHATPYAHRAIVGTHGKKLLMARAILDAPAGLCVDHINGNTLDNRRCNLRLATVSQNTANRHAVRPSSSPFTGVSWNKQRSMWKAQIEHMGKGQYLGLFADEEDAARAYDAAARLHFGEFAKLNFPQEA